MKRFNFIKNALLLTATSLLLRGIGMALRIYISGKIGAEGMGLYQLIFSVYFLMITFAQSGVSISMTKLVTERLAVKDEKGAVHMLKTALYLAALLGISTGLVMYFGADFISKSWIGDMRCVLSLRALAFSLPFIAICSVLSGYFVARRNVVYNCAAQIIEQLVRIAAVWAVAALFINKSLPLMLAAVVAGNTVSELISCIYLGACVYLNRRKNLYNSYKSAGRGSSLAKLVRTGAPIAASRYLSTALRTGENMLVPGAIAQFTKSRTTALEQFGALKGMAIPVLFFPSSFLSTLSTLLVPEVTTACALRKGDVTRRIISRAVFITLTLSVMIGGAFTVFARQIGMLVYNSEQVGFIIAVLAPITPFMYMDTIADGLLKGLGKQVSALKHNSIDSAIRIALIIALVPFYGMKGFLFVMLVSNILIASLNMHALLKAAQCRMNWSEWIVKPCIGAFTAGALAHGLFGGAKGIIQTVAGCAVFCGVYAVVMALLFVPSMLKFKRNSRRTK